MSGSEGGYLMHLVFVDLIPVRYMPSVTKLLELEGLSRELL